MSARKLSRIAGLALVVAAVFGGVASGSSALAAGGTTESTTSTSVQMRAFDTIWT